MPSIVTLIHRLTPPFIALFFLVSSAVLGADDVRPQINWQRHDQKHHGSRDFKVSDSGNGVMQVDLRRNEWVVLYADSLPNLDMAPVPVVDNTNYWGTISPVQKRIDEPNPKPELFK